MKGISVFIGSESMMTVLFKKFSFWLLLFSIVICLFNLSGNDDYNILIFFTNPDTTFLFKPIIYLSHIAFWGLVGLLIDFIRVRVSKKSKN